MRKQPLYRTIASIVDARLTCIKRGDTEWLSNHTDRLEAIAKDYLPHGSGFDSGTTIDLDRSTGDKLVFCTSFHHMNDGGYYDGWTDHEIIVKPSLVFGFVLHITGRDRRQIKDYMYEVFQSALSEIVEA